MRESHVFQFVFQNTPIARLGACSNSILRIQPTLQNDHSNIWIVHCCSGITACL